MVTGVKACGKTETARQAASSEVLLESDEAVSSAIAYDPSILLEGSAPRLLDEWQEYPRIWNLVRRAVDARLTTGQFILTGSSNPADQVMLHSGVGRFSVMRMRTMTWHERGWSTGEVSLSDVIAGQPIASKLVEPGVDSICERLLTGGWPGLLGHDTDSALAFARKGLSHN
ncbi:MAG: AAA family ATPase [Bifidobacteriaceae bacterium]|nr:AAA family ATPase [Bifidobacteriaceae bacterium]